MNNWIDEEAGKSRSIDSNKSWEFIFYIFERKFEFQSWKKDTKKLSNLAIQFDHNTNQRSEKQSRNTNSMTFFAINGKMQYFSHDTNIQVFPDKRYNAKQ